ncbi:inactive serine/threonine-protein kinase 19 isoform X2 [Alligator mississippiensis]|uniref:inactive serine/threonine-protein kinase 19 isoform X2 n=1 Tax=Alligator mississippiensis TaxID=8496 RepID=UPI00287802C4|nr:inactive serine/threonine-protein kinase 19 isoform X2 [Alligator mississippiensis]
MSFLSVVRGLGPNVTTHFRKRGRCLKPLPRELTSSSGDPAWLGVLGSERGRRDVISRGPGAMERRRRRLLADAFGAHKRRRRRQEPEPEGREAVEGALHSLAALFPRGLFDDALPPLVLRHQLYSLVPARTAVDQHLNSMKEEGLVRLFQLGFDTDAFGVVFTEDYKAKVVEAVAGKESEALVRRFLDSVLTPCADISYDMVRMMQDFGFRDADITQLVGAGVLTVRDAGSWWLAVPGAGRFMKAFLRGRKAVLALIQKARYREVLLAELQTRRPPRAVRLGLPYHIHDLIGAQLVRW